jgi:hypothetical protein
VSETNNLINNQVKDKQPYDQVKNKQPYNQVKDKQPYYQVKNKQPYNQVKDKQPYYQVKNKQPYDQVKNKQLSGQRHLIWTSTGKKFHSFGKIMFFAFLFTSGIIRTRPFSQQLYCA